MQHWQFYMFLQRQFLVFQQDPALAVASRYLDAILRHQRDAGGAVLQLLRHFATLHCHGGDHSSCGRHQRYPVLV